MFFNAGSKILSRIAMIAITTKSSINVKAFFLCTTKLLPAEILY